MKITQIAATAAIITMAATACANARPSATTRDTNLRKGPGTASEVVTLIPGGARIDIGACANGWCRASWHGQDGYVIIQNLALARARPPLGRVIAGMPADGADVYPAEPAYGPPAYYGYGPGYPPYGPDYGPYYYGGGWGYRGGWGWGRHW